MKKQWKRVLSLALIIWLMAGFGVQAAPDETIPFYEEGEVVGFIGDSITHVEYSSINYVEFLYNYYLSHFPNQEVEFRNLGVSSYKASDILDIYDRDKGFRGLDKALILLGMNEGLQEVSKDIYIANMEKLVDKLKKDGLKGEDIIVFSPTPYDETCNCNFDSAGNPRRKTDTKYLTPFTEALAEKTKEWGVRYVDLHTPMLELTAEIQKDDKDRTLTIWDSVHPDTLGQMVMAYELLKANGAEPKIAEIVIPAEGEAEAVNGTVSDLFRGEKGLIWNYKPEALPMAMTEEFQIFVEYLFDLVGALNQIPLQVGGLKEEVSYTLTMGDETLGTFTGKELAEGVNLAVLENNPLQKAMMEAEALNQQWHPNSAEYRKIVRFATMATPTHTMEQMEEAYQSWKNTDVMLRDGMYEIVQKAVKQTYSMALVEEGSTAALLEEEKAAAEAARLAEEQAAKEALEEQAAAEENTEPLEHKSRVMTVFLSVGGVVLVLSVGTAIVLWFCLRREQNTRKKRKKRRRRK